MRNRLLLATSFFSVLALGIAGPAHAAAQYSDTPAKPGASGRQGGGASSASDQEGPNKSVDETVVVPRKRPTKPPQPPPQPKTEKINPDEAYAIRTEVELVSVGVVVQDKNGQFLPGLKRENFRIIEDGVPQTIKKVEAAEAPMTVVMLIEFSSLYWQFLYQTMQAAYGFVQSLRPEDWVAVIAYDIRPEILQDFTKNKAAAFGALNMMQIPGFSESNMFDALADAMSRMDNIEGKKAILLISSGVDTFSKIRYDQLLKKVQATDTPIYAIGTGQAIREIYDARGMMGSSTQIGFLQADNQLRSFARLSGGKSYFPRFEGQFGEIYNDISASLRNEYNISYTPTNTAHDGKFRKLKVELVDQDGKPVRIVDQKGKEIKYEIRAREGYTAPRPVE
jgi:VWFA-related protein